MKYKVLSGITITELEEKVANQIALDAGWRVCGGVSSGYGYYLQAMVIIG